MAHGKRAGSRRGARPQQKFRPVLLALAGGVTLAVVAWGYLVFAAIDFGTQARAGRSSAWWLLALASIGAVACLFVGLMLIAQLSRALGITSPPPDDLRAPSAPEADPLSAITASTQPTVPPRHAGPSGATRSEWPPPEHDSDPPTGEHRALG
ncbi:hypothetical protein [Nocardioides salsibiostraticola]